VTIAALDKLAEFHMPEDIFLEALVSEDYYERALRGCVIHFGKDHSRTRKALHHLKDCIFRGEHISLRRDRRMREINTEY